MQKGIVRRPPRADKSAFELCKRKEIPPDIKEQLLQMVTHCEQGNFRAAHDHYLQAAIGKAAWPIGITMVGIHERSGRERLSESKVAHVMNNEMQRKYFTSVKRLISYAAEQAPPRGSLNESPIRCNNDVLFITKCITQCRSSFIHKLFAHPATLMSLRVGSLEGGGKPCPSPSVWACCFSCSCCFCCCCAASCACHARLAKLRFLSSRIVIAHSFMNPKASPSTPLEVQQVNTLLYFVQGESYFYIHSTNVVLSSGIHAI